MKELIKSAIARLTKQYGDVVNVMYEVNVDFVCKSNSTKIDKLLKRFDGSIDRLALALTRAELKRMERGF